MTKYMQTAAENLWPTCFNDFLYFGGDVEGIVDSVIGDTIFCLQGLRHRLCVVFQNEEGIFRRDADQFSALVPVNLARGDLDSSEN